MDRSPWPSRTTATDRPTHQAGVDLNSSHPTCDVDTSSSTPYSVCRTPRSNRIPMFTDSTEYSLRIRRIPFTLSPIILLCCERFGGYPPIPMHERAYAAIKPRPSHAVPIQQSLRPATIKNRSHHPAPRDGRRPALPARRRSRMTGLLTRRGRSNSVRVVANQPRKNTTNDILGTTPINHASGAAADTTQQTLYHRSIQQILDAPGTCPTHPPQWPCLILLPSMMSMLIGGCRYQPRSLHYN